MSKYVALFAGTAGAREWQRTVVEEACLENSFDVLLRKIHLVAGSLRDRDPITAFARSVHQATECNYESARVPFPTFFDDVYPAYLEAMAAHVDYFLSDIELLALARCKRQNVAIFVHDQVQGQLIYARSYIEDPALPVVATSLLDNGEQGAVRTHFERLRLSPPHQRISAAVGQRACEEDGQGAAKRARIEGGG